MEVKQYHTPKKLHHHAIPVIIITVAMLVISTPFVLRQNSVAGSGAALIHDLSTRTFHITPASHGLAHVTLNKNTQRYISPEVSQAGRTAELTFALAPANP